MRIVPVGLAYRNAAPEVLRQAVEDAICCTHHPEAVDGAVVQAKAVAIAAMSDPESFDPTDMLQSLMPLCQTERIRAKLDSDSLRHGDDDVFVIARVGNRIRASEAVAAALWAFLRYGTKGEECLIRAVSFGGDTDTVGAWPAPWWARCRAATGFRPAGATTPRTAFLVAPPMPNQRRRVLFKGLLASVVDQADRFATEENNHGSSGMSLVVRAKASSRRLLDLGSRASNSLISSTPPSARITKPPRSPSSFTRATGTKRKRFFATGENSKIEERCPLELVEFSNFSHRVIGFPLTKGFCRTIEKSI